jgi:hypothetical protein
VKVEVLSYYVPPVEWEVRSEQEAESVEMGSFVCVCVCVCVCVYLGEGGDIMVIMYIILWQVDLHSSVTSGQY